MFEDFIIADITETDDAQIILNRPYLATSNCNIDVKVGHITFDVEGCYTMFCFMDEKVISLNFPNQMHFSFHLRLTWRTALVVKTLPILIGFPLSISTKGTSR